MQYENVFFFYFCDIFRPQCDDCSAVFHAECLSSLHPCPKCERKRKREDLPLLDVIHQTDATEEFVSEENCVL